LAMIPSSGEGTTFLFSDSPKPGQSQNPPRNFVSSWPVRGWPPCSPLRTLKSCMRNKR
jgi:hypothetical protein